MALRHMEEKVIEMPKAPRYRFFKSRQYEGDVIVKNWKYDYIGVMARYRKNSKVKTSLFGNDWETLKIRRK